MASMQELEKTAKALAAVVREHQTEMAKGFQVQIAELQKQIEAIKSIPVDLDAIIAKKVAQIEVPKGEPGKDADIELVRRMVAEAVAAIPVPENGKDADPQVIREMVAEAVAQIPPPKDGESVDPESIKAMVDDAVNEAVSQIPAPQDGKSVTPEQVMPELEKKLADLVAQIPPAEPGKDANPEDVVPLVMELIRQPEDGKSVTIEEVTPLIEGLIKEAVDAIPVPQDGKPGKDGESVCIDAVKAMVNEAVNLAVSAIEPAKNGEDGRDALDIEILPDIDPDKSYSRGTYAQHNGGLWRSFQRTHGMKGWECIVDGIAAVDIEMTDHRHCAIKTVTASGCEKVKEFALPSVLYRGIFKEGERYYPGDTATWGGSIWYCETETADKPGETGSKGWILSVKRGQNGKDLRPDEPRKNTVVSLEKRK